MIDTPDASSTAVFSKGTENGFNGHTPVGGQLHPISKVGANLLWKKAQKNALKNITSEVINRIIPHSNPRCTFEVCIPKYVASRNTSRHQNTIVSIITRRDKGKIKYMFTWNQ